MAEFKRALAGMVGIVGAGLRPARPGLLPRSQPRQAAMPDLNGSDSGQALPLALIALALGVILVTILIMAVNIYMGLSSASASDLLDYYSADAGIERAIVPLVADPNAYPSATTLALTLNSRSVSVNVVPLGSQVIPDPVASLTTTITSYLVTAQTGDLNIKARAEARLIIGQPTAAVRISAWKVGQ